MTIDASSTAGKSGKSAKSKRNRRKASKERFHIVHFTNPSGETVFRVAGYKPDGTRVRENWPTEEEATGRKAELDIEAANIKTTTATRLKATRLTDEQIREAEAIYTKLNGKPLLPIFDCGLANYDARSCASGPPQNCPHSLPPPMSASPLAVRVPRWA